MAVETLWVDGFKGLNDSLNPGVDPHFTTDLKNVKIQHGFVRGRGGISNYLGITTAASADIIGLFEYARQDGTNFLVRLLPTKLEKLNTGTVAWDDITGTALTATTANRPQSTVIDDTLVFTNQVDKPRKWPATGNSASIALGTSPYCKSIESYLGFLFLGYISDNGTFSDTFDGHRMIRYSDDWDNDWSLCQGNEIILDETPGALKGMRVLGRDCICIKEDGVVKVTWTGGALRFRQERMATDIGCIAPLSIQRVSEAGILFLGTDAVIYLITPDGSIRPVSYEQLQNTLPPILSTGDLAQARSFVDRINSTYYVFTNSTSSIFQRVWAAYNYRSGEFTKGVIDSGTAIVAAQDYRPTTEPSSVPVLLASDSNKKVIQFDSGAYDLSAHVERYITTGWITMNEEGWLKGVRIQMKRDPSTRLRVSVARDFENKFRYEQLFTVKGKYPDADFVELRYNPPATIYGRYFNIKIRMFHNYDSSATELRRIGFEVEPKHTTQQANARGGQPTKGGVK